MERKKSEREKRGRRLVTSAFPTRVELAKGTNDSTRSDEEE